MNVEYFPDFIKYSAEQGVKYIHFEAVSTNPDNRYLMPDKAVYVESVKRAIDVADKYNVFLINSAYMNLLTPCDRFCSSVAGAKILYGPDGTMSLCYKVQSAATANRDFVVGSYNVITDKFEVDYETIQKMKALSVDAFAECEFCFARLICAGGCPNRNFSTTGDFSKPDPWMCSVKKELIRDAIFRIYSNSRENKRSVLLGSSYFESMVNEKHKGDGHGRKERIAVC